MGDSGEPGSKMRSDAIIKEDPRAQVLIAPPGTNPANYTQANTGRGGRRGSGRGRGARRGGGRNGGASQMEID
ncbi:hypothetical protein AN958_11409 [Leucoagaricus sp. SymC.cos]|nr:hypothetical protein AN958_11409 [Leucoagaricus sp. SymC.cos]